MTQYNDWQAFLFRTTTGVVGPQVHLKEGADYSIPLSDNSSGKFSLDKTKLPQIPDLDFWLDSWGTGILYTFKGRAIYAGVIISNPREYAKEIQFDTSGIRSVLARRYVVHENDVRGPNLSKSVVSYRKMSLGTIAQEVVKKGMDKPGGNLPIRFISPRETTTDDADHQRTYKAFEITNLSVDAVLTKLQEVGGGPDVMFRPRLVHDSQMVWEMHHGTENDPRIAQSDIPQWDLTAVKSSAASLEITKTGSYLTDRVYSVGGGTNEATIMSVSEDLSRTQRGYPLLESVVTSSDSTNKSVVINHGNGSLRQNRKPLKEFTLFVDVRGEPLFGTYWPGDLVVVYTKGFMNIPDGPNKMRLLNMSGQYGASQVRLALQLDDQWD